MWPPASEWPVLSSPVGVIFCRFVYAHIALTEDKPCYQPEWEICPALVQGMVERKFYEGRVQWVDAYGLTEPFLADNYSSFPCSDNR